MYSDRPVYSLNVDEFRGLIKDALNELIGEKLLSPPKPHTLVNGAAGLADALGVCRQTATRIIKSHVIDKAITYRSPKTYTIDVEYAQELLANGRKK